ncbi:hypothetical protein RIR_jg39348.t1 [Rhizophagus irregularis DAOM 181602=DAOM 197198]|nr:hypothetical protein RIR_jg39348.t1 [Rhizophagus irregularis DAOM 181602=DAOM 197198]
MFFVYIGKEGKDEIFSGLFLDLAQDLDLSDGQFFSFWTRGKLRRPIMLILKAGLLIFFFFDGRLFGLTNRLVGGPSVLLEVLVSTFGDRLVVDFSLLIEWEKKNCFLMHLSFSDMVFGFCWVLADMISFEDS